MSTKVIVTNKGTEPWAAKWNGFTFTFAVGEPVTLPVAAATFLFNYGRPREMVERVLVQNGWLKSSNASDEFGRAAALKRLDAFIFKKAAEEPRKVPQAIVLPSLTRTPAQPAERTTEASTASVAAGKSMTEKVLEKIPGFGKSKGDAAQASPGAT